MSATGVAPIRDGRFDAFVLADTLRHKHRHWRSLSIPSAPLAEIRALTRDRDRLLETQQATEYQLRSILAAFHSAPTKLFSSIDRQITLAFIQDHPTPQSASRRRDEVTDILDGHGFTKAATSMREAKHDVVVFTAFPKAHWRRIWSNNPLYGFYKEIKRRTNLVGIFPNDAAVIRLVCAILDGGRSAASPLPGW